MNNKNKGSKAMLTNGGMPSLGNPLIQFFVFSIFLTTILPYISVFWRKLSKGEHSPLTSDTNIVKLNHQTFNVTKNYLYQSIERMTDDSMSTYPQMNEIQKILNRPINLMPNIRPTLINLLARVIFSQKETQHALIQKIKIGIEQGKINHLEQKPLIGSEDGVVSLAIELGEKSHLLPKYSTSERSLKYFFANLYSLIDNAPFTTQLCLENTITVAHQEGESDEEQERPYGFSKSSPNKKCLGNTGKEYESIQKTLSTVQYQRAYCTNYKEKKLRKSIKEGNLENQVEQPAHLLASAHHCNDFVEVKEISYISLFNMLP